MAGSAPIVIIGTGLAGYNLAKEIRKLDQDIPLLLVTRDDGHSYSKPMLSTALSKGKDAEALSMADPDAMAQQFGLEILAHSNVTDLNPELKKLSIGAKKISYDKLVLATGARVNQLPVAGSNNPNVLSINNLTDYRVFRKTLAGKQRVVIIGAGLIGSEFANDLLMCGFQVSVVSPTETVLEGLIPKAAGQAVAQGLKSAGAEFYFGRGVSAISATSSGAFVSLDDGTRLDADLVITAIGLRPDLALAEQAGLKTERGIIVNRYLETSMPDIYALGDCAEVDSHLLLYVLPLMACARALAQTLCGEATQVSYGIMPVTIKTPACPVVTVPPWNPAGNWHFEGSGLNVKGLYQLANGDLAGYVLTGDCVVEKNSLSRQICPIHS